MTWQMEGRLICSYFKKFESVHECVRHEISCSYALCEYGKYSIGKYTIQQTKKEKGRMEKIIGSIFKHLKHAYLKAS